MWKKVSAPSGAAAKSGTKIRFTLKLQTHEIVCKRRESVRTIRTWRLAGERKQLSRIRACASNLFCAMFQCACLVFPRNQRTSNDHMAHSLERTCSHRSDKIQGQSSINIFTIFICSTKLRSTESWLQMKNFLSNYFHL